MLKASIQHWIDTSGRCTSDADDQLGETVELAVGRRQYWRERLGAGAATTAPAATAPTDTPRVSNDAEGAGVGDGGGLTRSGEVGGERYGESPGTSADADWRASVDAGYGPKMLAGGGGCSTEDSGAAGGAWPGREAVGGASPRG
ncbi:hypothetical protein PF005_g25991 [Phytophthora fragariae]|uniref:Uncharacterized protein n=1 Tax=Phytophthora fragariae TaxID=53985 RepID=A0A6A3VXD6_9STRA|nr:hypothetical protein PF005_g25991 [Phytophthora fragariae]